MKDIIIVCFLFAGSLFDAKLKKLPNYFTLPLLFSGIIFNLIGGTISVFEIIINILIVIIIFGHGFACGYIGGGDIKLLLAVACWMELKVFIVFILSTLIVGAIFAFYNILSEFKHISIDNILIEPKIILLKEKLHNKKGKKIPYAVCMFLGFLVTTLIL